MMTVTTTGLFLCGPQARFPSGDEIEQLRQTLLDQKDFCHSLIATLKGLPDILQKLAALDGTLKRFPLVASIDFLLQWLESGTLSLPVNTLPNISSFPFTILLQTALFLRHLARTNTGPDYRPTIQSLQKYGVQGFCTGFLTAAAIGFSRNEEQLAEFIAMSLRLAACIGAYVDHNASSSPVCALSIRWREGQFSRSQVEDFLTGYKHVRVLRFPIY
jgi:hypothetical protein